MTYSRSSGILAHPTSFHTDFGIGDLGPSTFKFIDFLKKSGQKLWQILPLSPTSFGDSPYQSFSTFAGNTYLISPEILFDEKLVTKEDVDSIKVSYDYIDYGKVIDSKSKIFRLAFENFKTCSSIEKKSELSKFCDDNKLWIDDFALFISLKNHFIKERSNAYNSPEYLEFKDLNKDYLTENEIKDNFYGATWNSWPKPLATRETGAIKLWTEKLQDEIYYNKFLQFVFFKQWGNVKKYANDNQISIIGDLPIFVSMDSSDVWSNPTLFLLGEQGYPVSVAGVPPDYFSETGQLWGNPLYNWANHKITNYKWWIDRVSYNLKTIDFIRIDHFRGFDAYWSVPYGEKTAINGKWLDGPKDDLFIATREALGDLPILAEDLGLITKGVEELRDNFNFPGMKILQFAFDDSEENVHIPHSFTSANFVVYTGTHDNDTTLGWYEKTSDSNRDHLRRYLNVDGSNITWDLIRLAFSTVANFAIIPVQDILNLNSGARMNTPGVASNNWRFSFSQESLTDDISDKLSYLTKLFDR